MINDPSRQHVANFMLKWIRSDHAHEKLVSMTQREIRNEIVRLVAGEDETRNLRIANEFTRWIFSGSPDVPAMRWRDDTSCRNYLLRLIDRAADKDGAENDTDIVDDMTARSYPRLREQLNEQHQAKVAFVRGKQLTGASIVEAEQGLAQMTRQGLDDWEFSG